RMSATSAIVWPQKYPSSRASRSSRGAGAGPFRRIRLHLAPFRSKIKVPLFYLPASSTKMDTKDLVTVYTLSDPVRAEIIRAALQAEGIRCFLDGVNTAGLASIGAFEIKIQVPAGDADRASRFIQSHEARPHASKRTGF